MNGRVFWLSIAGILSACGGTTDGTGGGTDTGTSDTATLDTAQIDSTADTGAPIDTGSSETTSDAPTDSPGGACGDKTCGKGEVCTRVYTSGGPCMMCGDDAAACPSGYHCSGSCCVVDKPSYTYTCKPAPSCGALTCETCGKALCESWCPCESVAGGVVTCHCLAP